MLARSFARQARAKCTRTASAAFSSLPNDPVIVSFARTPVASFQGDFAHLTAPQLGSIAARGAIERAGIEADLIQEAFLGNVIATGQGQAPTRQVVLGAGIPNSVPCTTINKVCASGTKSVMIGAMSIMTGHQDIVLCGGFESMSNIPYHLPKARAGLRLGDSSIVDGLVSDGLWDPYGNTHMGVCGEKCSEEYNISREAQDDYALESYARAKAAWESGATAEEIVPVDAGQRGVEKLVTEDSEFKLLKADKIKTLRPAFQKDGTVTAANSSKINDGAAAMVVMSAARAKELGCTPILRIRGFGDAAQEPYKFTTSPALAVPIAAKHAGVSMTDIEYHEINEAFSVVALANIELMNLDPARVNANGGAVALGHPIGMSGARIIGALHTVLKQNDATLGAVSICNGGGGAAAMILERV
mmetsp:Transcript_2453/g.3672  ORF Transcript_2453/g.3672 Transcript_2453/m.3672 type:complete len:417 (+) Transcript_2453:75-1325(+)|eukprot:CAMPEP_0195524202 /NCGR_PEP_ID=MMETSP0794_2-20130614/23901_1 /TAXON_ID=515487 /ORGANISM="Stephanopyxis turris, Strain CCMP 815" /LENGTH=416 /DNA_ID=CAMNT_0040654377 /DNA_START=74 /DNA_END=1324 /DNA_ORIENTATION=-